MVAWYWLIISFVGGLVFATISWNAVEWNNVLIDISLREWLSPLFM